MENMLPRERVLAALSHKVTDRVPLDFWAVPETWAKLKEYFKTDDEEVVLQNLGIDIRQFQPDYTGEVLTLDDGSYFDPMGVHRIKVKNRFSEYEEYASAPLGFAKTVEDLERYERWPDIEKFDFASLSNKIGDAHEKYYIKLETGGLFELSWALRGYEQFMMDMVLNPEIPHAIMSRLTDFYCEYVKRALENAGDKIDMIYTYDDVASQNGLLMSKDMWKEFIQPYHKKLNRTIKSYGKTIMYHSCGAVYTLIEDLIDLPIDVLNPLQPLAAGMDMEEIKRNFGGRLCFHGAIDIQFLLPKGSRQEVAETVKKTIRILGAGGGYILSSAHYIQADTPVENIITMYETAKNVSLQNM